MNLQDYSFDAPTIEVLSASPRLEMLQIRLRQAGMRPVPVENGFDPNSAQPLFLDTLTAPNEAIAAIAASWIGQQTKRLLVVLGNVPASLQALTPLTLSSIDQIHALTARIAIRQRDLKRKRELALRTKTQLSFGAEAEEIAFTRAPHRALYLGVGTPEFVSLKSALHKHDVELLAALSAYTAKDYLATGQFGAIILKPEQDADQSSIFLQEFRASDYDARLALIVLESDKQAGGLRQRLAEKAHMLIGAEERPQTVAETLAAYLNVAPSQTTPRLTSTVYDLKTGLYSRSFFEAHLQAQMDDAEGSGDALSIIHLRQRGAVNTLKEVGEALSHSLRETDIAAAISRNEICISMPATNYRGAISFVRRMEPRLGPSIEWKAIERRRFHTVKSLMTGFALPPQRQMLRKA